LNPIPKEYSNDSEIFWDCFDQSIKANGYNGKRRTLSIIAEKFSYKVLMSKLKVSIRLNNLHYL
jgi:hypothetical protein